MRAIGIIRRIDGAGRIVIPKEIRKSYGLEDDSLIEIFSADNGIVLKKHRTGDELMNAMNAFGEAVEGSADDLDYEKVREIRKHIREIRGLLK